MAERKNVRAQKLLHRVEELRKSRGMSQEELGNLIGRNKWFISRLEKGVQDLDLATANEIAKKLRVDVGDVLAVTTSASAEPGAGFSEDVKEYEPASGDKIAKPTEPNRRLYEVLTDACANAGIGKGDIIEIDLDVQVIRTMRMGDIAVVLYHPPGERSGAKELLRQFMPPTLLITNAPRGENARSIDPSIEDAQIVGVFVGLRRKPHHSAN